QRLQPPSLITSSHSRPTFYQLGTLPLPPAKPPLPPTCLLLLSRQHLHHPVKIFERGIFQHNLPLSLSVTNPHPHTQNPLQLPRRRPHIRPPPPRPPFFFLRISRILPCHLSSPRVDYSRHIPVILKSLLSHPLNRLIVVQLQQFTRLAESQNSLFQ